MTTFSAKKTSYIEMTQNYAVCLKSIKQSSVLVIWSEFIGSAWSGFTLGP